MVNDNEVDVRYERTSIYECGGKRIRQPRTPKSNIRSEENELEVPACQPRLVKKPSPGLPGNNSGRINGSLAAKALPESPSASKTGTTGPRSIFSEMNCVCRARPIFP